MASTGCAHARTPQKRSAERLASATQADSRISRGCVVVPVASYESVVAPLLGHVRSDFYVMPEEAASSRVGLLR